MTATGDYPRVDAQVRLGNKPNRETDGTMSQVLCQTGNEQMSPSSGYSALARVDTITVRIINITSANVRKPVSGEIVERVGGLCF